MIKLKPRFESAALIHLDAAHNLARWLVRDPHAAQDMVQEACLRALRYYDSFRGDDIRPWLLGIVRNTCYTWLKQNQLRKGDVEFDEELDGGTELNNEVMDGNPESLLVKRQQAMQVNQAISALPVGFREVLILREMEEFTYEEIATIAAIPMGTVMSRLSRARVMLRAALKPQIDMKEPS